MRYALHGCLFLDPNVLCNNSIPHAYNVVFVTMYHVYLVTANLSTKPKLDSISLPALGSKSKKNTTI